MSAATDLSPVAHIFFCKHQNLDTALSRPTVSLNFITSPNPSLYDFVILMCLVLFIPAVAMAKWRENYSADEIQRTHQGLHLCFNVTFFALAALATEFFKLGPHLHRHCFPPAARYFLYHSDGFISFVLVFFPLFSFFLTELQIHLGRVGILIKPSSVGIPHRKIIFLIENSSEAYSRYLKHGRNILKIQRMYTPVFILFNIIY